VVEMDPGRSRLMEEIMGKEVWHAKINIRKAETPGLQERINNLELSLAK